MRIDLDGQRFRKRGLVADECLKFSKGPLGVHAIGGCRAFGETFSVPLPFFLRLRKRA